MLSGSVSTRLHYYSRAAATARATPHAAARAASTPRALATALPPALNAADFLALPGVTLDVRAPIEFARGHVPHARALPLFSDAERAEVGTLFRTHGREAATLRGLELAGPRLAPLARAARALARAAPVPTLKVYCARGGARSAAVAWLLATAGAAAGAAAGGAPAVVTLAGGYRAFRAWGAARVAAAAPRLALVGGPTGAGKTAALAALRARGGAALDLEALAAHKGSAFGGLAGLAHGGGAAAPPTQEAFENALAWALAAAAADAGAYAPRPADAPPPRAAPRPLWVEDEARALGALRVPPALLAAMARARVHVLRPPRAERAARLAEDYGGCARADLAAAAARLQPRIGAGRAAAAAGAIARGDYAAAADALLHYYDPLYEKALAKAGARAADVPPPRAGGAGATSDEWAAALEAAEAAAAAAEEGAGAAAEAAAAVAAGGALR
jgi:tRNA 2-selenouridine synthase